ncbi:MULTISPECIES: hypothetical protein [Lentzea]|uniref:hypothetical protein n=1 Tax=Lentzea TaxID=165301 RepID=UPI001B86957E|nr:hypothetical protein [Lentzea atacamensis]
MDQRLFGTANPAVITKPDRQWLAAVPPLLVYVIVGLVIGFESLGISAAGRDRAGHGLAAGVAARPPEPVADRRVGERRRGLDGRQIPQALRGNATQPCSSRVPETRRVGRFFGRFVALLRILAGPLHMNCGKFLVANAAGGVVWAAFSW